MSREILSAFEAQLDPTRPEGGPFGCQVVGYGEVSAVLTLAALPGRVLKRMSGFPTAGEAAAYAAVVGRYLELLAGQEVPVASTERVQLAPEPDRHVVYLVQERLEEKQLGQVWLQRARDPELFELLGRVLETVARVLRANPLRDDGREASIDPQLSNWAWPGPGAEPLLVDVGTPFLRCNGALETGAEIFLRAFPPGIRAFVRRARLVERYIADYFRLDRVILDVLGNFIKEGASHRLEAGIAFANDWLAGQPEAERFRPIQRRRVEAYYRDDARTLAWMLRVRRLQRFVRTRLLLRRYDFILPGRIRRR